ncbi:MAG: AraC family transcriptional regulator ligand-binding domain-containing protein [Methylorubrum populi]
MTPQVDEALVDGMAWSGFDRAVRHLPGGAASVFRSLGLSPEAIDRPGPCTSLATYVRYFEVAAQMSGDPCFGLGLGTMTRAERSGIPGYLVLNARRFRDAIRDLARTLPTLVGGIHLTLAEHRDPPALLWSIVTDVGPSAQFTGHGNGFFVRMLQAHRGQRWRPVRVLCAMPEPPRPERYRSGLGCPVGFDSPVNAIELRRDELDAERTGVDIRLHALLSTYAQVLLDRHGPSACALETDVRMALRDGFALGTSDIEAVARRLDRSRRGLQRALAERGLSFRGLRDGERFALAQTLLRESRRPIGEIAARLGYAETAAFSRAFKTRFGTSPYAFRRADRR